MTSRYRRQLLAELDTPPLDTIVMQVLLLGAIAGLIIIPDAVLSRFGLDNPKQAVSSTVGNAIETVKSAPGKAVSATRRSLPSFVPGSTKPTSAKVTAIRRAIVGQESGGNFRAVNRHSRALGYGQVMPFNLPSWTKAAIGREVGEAEFLNSPSIQIKTIDHRMSRYWSDCQEKYARDKESVRCVAAKWYSGVGSKKDDDRQQYYKKHPYPSIKSYADSVFAKYQQEIRRN